jgi:hypothetical protein
MVIICAAVALLLGRWEGVAFGGLFGAALVSFELLIVVVVFAASASDSTFQPDQPGVLTQVGGVVLVLAGGLTALRSSARMTAAVSMRSDWRSFTGLIVVLAGLTINAADLANHSESAPWMWVLPAGLALVGVPIPLLQLNSTQRTAALTMVTGFVILAIDDAPWLVAAGVYPWVSGSDWWIICLPSVIVVIGCIVGQLPARPPAGVRSIKGPEG